MSEQDPGERPHEVRPRLVWAGTVAAVLGMVAIAVGMTTGTDPVTWIGVVVTVAALVLAWRAGIVYEVNAPDPHADTSTGAPQDRPAQGPAPTDRLDDPVQTRHARLVTRRTDAAMARTSHSPMPSFFPMAAVGLLVLGAWTFLAQFVLDFSFTVTGQNTALRDTGLAVVLLLAGLFLRLVGPSRIATLVCLAAGVLLVVSGVVAPHTGVAARASEIVTGCLVVLCSAVTWRR